MKDLQEAYLALGAGGLCVIVVIWILLFLVRKLYPIIASLKEETSAYKEIIKNNTDAVKEVSKSNDNVATALKLLDTSVGQLGTLIDRHDKRAEGIENEVIRIEERIKTIKNE